MTENKQVPPKYPPFIATDTELKQWQSMGEAVKQLEQEKPVKPAAAQPTISSDQK